jgi:transcriptional regulator with XRE-family HTH domain
MTEIGMELYNWRCNNNLSQREAAHTLGISQAQICAYEKGKHTPSSAVRARIMDKIRPAAEEEKPVQEDKPDEVLPFHIRLARSRGISDEYMQRTLDMVRNRDRDEDAPQDAQGAKPALPPASGAGMDKLLIGRMLGLLEGISAAYGIDLNKHISMLEAAGGEA